MKSDTKRYLKQYFEPPEAVGKEAFLQSVDRFQKVEHPGFWRMVGVQIRYISKASWIASAILFLTVLLLELAVEENGEYVRIVYAATPFFVLVALEEGTRSYRYGMEELELSARFSLRTVVLARMFLTGVGNLLTLCLLGLAMGGWWIVEMLYLLVPYLMTAAGGVNIIRRHPGRGGTRLCFLLAVLVSLGDWLLGKGAQFLYEPGFLFFWIAAFAASLAVCLKGSYHMIRMTEELVWN